MKKRITVVALVLALGVGVGIAVAGSAEGKTVEGTLVDTKCYIAYGAKTNDHGDMKGCGTACAKGGNPVGVLTAEGKYVTLAVAAPAVADHVGHTVRATGDLKEGVLLPKKLEMKEGNAWKEIKLGPTM